MLRTFYKGVSERKLLDDAQTVDPREQPTFLLARKWTLFGLGRLGQAKARSQDPPWETPLTWRGPAGKREGREEEVLNLGCRYHFLAVWLTHSEPQFPHL